MEFCISLTSFQQIQTFIALATKQPFDILVGNERQRINGKDFMGMFSLDYTRPLLVHANCTPEEFAKFQQDVLAFAN